MPESIPPFEEDLRLWQKGEVPGYLRLSGLFLKGEFLSWNEQTLPKTKSTLANLHSRYRIRPIAVLNILGYASINLHCQPASDHPTFLKSSRKKIAWVKKLKKYIKDLESLEGKIPVSIDDQRKARDVLREILKNLPSIQPGHPKDYFVRWCTWNLATFFKKVTGRPLYGYIGSLLRDGFGTAIWNPAADEREAVRKLLKRLPTRLTPEPIVAESLILQERGPSGMAELYSKSVELGSRSPEALTLFNSYLWGGKGTALKA